MDIVTDQHTDREGRSGVFPLALWFSPERLKEVITSLSLGHPDNMVVHTAFFILGGYT